MRLAKIISTFFGVGYIRKGGGTVAAAIACLIWYVVANFYTGWHSLWQQAAVIVLIFFIGVVCGNKVEAIWGEDSYRVVWDEVLGMCVSLFAVPVMWWSYLAALILFRFFDIVKPLYIKRMERFSGGWGVMLDDVLAGVYANIVLQIILTLVAIIYLRAGV